MPHRRSALPVALLAAGIGCAAHAPAALAQSRWIHSFSAPVQVERDSNPALRVGGGSAVTRLRAAPQVHARYRLDAHDLELEAAAVLERSSDPPVSSNRADPRLRADWRHASPRSRQHVFAVFERSAYRSVETDEQVPIGVDGTRSVRSIGAAVSHQLTPQTSVSADARHDRVSFDPGTTPGYRLATFNAGVARASSETSSWHAVAAHRAYRPAAGAATGSSGSSSLSFGYRSSLSELIEWELEAGVVKFAGTASDLRLQGSARAAYSLDRLQASVEVSRRPTVVPLNASVSLSDAARIQLRLLLDPRSSLVLEAQGSRLDAPGSARARLVSLAFLHELAPAWMLSLRWSQRQRQDATGSARGNVVGLGLSYSRPDF